MTRADGGRYARRGPNKSAFVAIAGRKTARAPHPTAGRDAQSRAVEPVANAEAGSSGRYGTSGHTRGRG
jgi:hypothetical protein